MRPTVPIVPSVPGHQARAKGAKDTNGTPWPPAFLWPEPGDDAAGVDAEWDAIDDWEAGHVRELVKPQPDDLGHDG